MVVLGAQLRLFEAQLAPEEDRPVGVGFAEVEEGEGFRLRGGGGSRGRAVVQTRKTDVRVKETFVLKPFFSAFTAFVLV